jgi:hypothetical protein
MSEVINAGHIFRSKLLDKFAGLESWAVKCMSAGKQPVSNAPFGQKIAVLTELCAKTPPLFKSAKKILERLERLKPYQDLRCSVVHSQIECLSGAKGAVSFCFRNVAQGDTPACYRPVMLTPQDCDDILREVGKIGNELKQLTAKPSRLSPPRPLPGAAGGL